MPRWARVAQHLWLVALVWWLAVSAYLIGTGAIGYDIDTMLGGTIVTYPSPTPSRALGFGPNVS